MSPFEKRVLSVCIHKPDKMIPLLKTFGNQGHVHAILEKWFGIRVGLEFEVGHDLLNPNEVFSFNKAIVTSASPNYGIRKSLPEVTISFKGFRQLLHLKLF